MFRASLSIFVLIILTFVSYTAVALEVSIDIKPGSDVNPINLKSKGVIVVAILSTEQFDATTIDVTTVAFQDATPTHGEGHIEDVNEDGLLDWVGHFRTQETGIACEDTEATITGQTSSGVSFTGTDSITIVGCKETEETKTKGNNGKALGHEKNKDDDQDEGEDAETEGNNGKALGHEKNKDDDQDEGEDAETESNNGKALGHGKNESPKGPKKSPSLQYSGKKALTWGSLRATH